MREFSCSGVKDLASLQQLYSTLWCGFNLQPGNICMAEAQPKKEKRKKKRFKGEEKRTPFFFGYHKTVPIITKCVVFNSYLKHHKSDFVFFLLEFTCPLWLKEYISAPRTNS